MLSSLSNRSQLATPLSGKLISGTEQILAAIDVGTNSIHMVIVRITPQIPSFTVLAKQKETARLGEYCDRTGNLTEAAMTRGYEALGRFLQMAEGMQADAIVAVATSAVREAPNGQVFLEQVKRGLGLSIDLISGQEEARRIYLGAISAMDLGGQPHVFVDIGGGSTELILGDGHEPDFLRSIKVGAVRLTQQFLRSDPPTSDQIQSLRDHVRGKVEIPLRQVRELLGPDPVRLIATSGTAETLTGVILRQTQPEQPSRIHGSTLELEALQGFVQQIQTLTLAERLKIPGLVERRAEIILAGAVILEEIMTLVAGRQLTFCGRSLREGLIVDWMLSHGLIEDRLRFQSSVRRRHTLKLANKYQVELEYAQRVAEFAVSLFDQTQGILHQWRDEDRELLWVAAMLHNCGHFVSHSAHHKHSYYLIRYGDLLGFNEDEMEVIANLARYHRKSAPKKKHENYQRLPSDQDRQRVSELSPLLRLATALDRRRVNAIRALHCRYEPSPTKPKILHLGLDPFHPEDKCGLEIWSLNEKKLVFEQQFNLELRPHLN